MLELLFLAAGIAAFRWSASKDDWQKDDRASDYVSRFKPTGGIGIHSSSKHEGYWKPHLTGMLDDEPVHIPYKGQTTFGMLDMSQVSRPLNRQYKS